MLEMQTFKTRKGGKEVIAFMWTGEQDKSDIEAALGGNCMLVDGLLYIPTCHESGSRASIGDWIVKRPRRYDNIVMDEMKFHKTYVAA